MIKIYFEFFIYIFTVIVRTMCLPEFVTGVNLLGKRESMFPRPKIARCHKMGSSDMAVGARS